jgi:hypothetical protein
MTSVSISQLTLNLEPSVIERWPTLREYVAYRIETQNKLAKTIAADMDLSPGTLSRKLRPSDGDTQRFNVDDLEGYLASTGDAAAIVEYIAAKFLGGGDEARRARAVNTVETLIPELQRALLAIKGGKK